MKGKIEWISIRPKTGEIKILDKVEVSVENGLIGDRYKKKNGKRQVTLIQKEHFPVISSFLNNQIIQPELTRRNIIASGINLLSCMGHHLKIGNQVILEVTGNCHPCNNMDKNLGQGGCAAMEGMGGITTRVIQGGIIKLNDEISMIKVEAK